MEDAHQGIGRQIHADGLLHGGVCRAELPLQGGKSREDRIDRERTEHRQPGQQPACDGPDPIGRIGGSFQRSGTRPRCEVPQSDLDRHRPREQSRLAHPLGHCDGIPVEHPRDLLGIGQVGGECVLHRDGFCLALGLHRPIIPGECQFVQRRPGRGAEFADQLFRRHLLKIRHAGHAQPGQPLHRGRPDTRHSPHRKRGDHLELAARSHHQSSVGFGRLGSELGDQLARSHPHRGAQSLGATGQFGAQRADQLVQASDRAGVDTTGGEIDIGLVQAQRLDQRAQLAQQRHHDAAGLPVGVEAAAQIGSMRGPPSGFAGRHRRTDAESARLVTRGGDHAPSADTADDHRLATQRWLVALLNRRIEGIHVDMDDLSHL